MRYIGQEMRDELLKLLVSAYLSSFISYCSDLCILSSCHIELSEVIQINHIFSLPFNVLLPLGMFFSTLFIYLISNSALNSSYVLLPSLVLSTSVLQDTLCILVTQHFLICCDHELISFVLQ